MISFSNVDLSIIIPVYNTQAYLSRCLDSVINQSFKKIEILIVNDMSTDDSEKIILEYSNKDERIKYLSMKAKGLAGGSRNYAMDHAIGKYIGFVDSDDWIDINMYEKMISHLEKTNADIAVCGVLNEYESKYEVTKRYIYEIENVLEGNFAFELLCRKNNQDIAISPIVCNKIYKSEFLKQNEISFLVNNCNEDDIFNFKCFLNASRVALTPNTYYHYYQRQDSITHVFSKKNIDDLILAFKFMKEYLINKNIFEKYRKHYYSFFEKCFSFVLEMMITSEPNTVRQNEYIKYFFSNCDDIIGALDYIDYFGAKRLRNILLPRL